MGMGALGQRNTEPCDTQAARRGHHLEAAEREAAALLLQPCGVHRPQPVKERQAARVDGTRRKRRYLVDLNLDTLRTAGVQHEGPDFFRLLDRSRRGNTPMLWRLWQQHRADRAEAVALRHYLPRHGAHRALCDVIDDAKRRADIRWRLDNALDSQRHLIES
jgi:hypothetical protein